MPVCTDQDSGGTLGVRFKQGVLIRLTW